MGNAQPARVPQQNGNEHAEPAERHPAGQGSSVKRPASIKASGRRAQKLQQYSSLTMSKLRSPNASSSPTTETGTGTETTTGPTTTGPTTTGPTTPAATNTNAIDPTVATTPSPQVEPQKQPEGGEDEMALVKSFLAQSQQKPVLPPASPQPDDEIRDMCLLCEREFLVSGKSFYVLELCGHGYCVECLYRYLQEELAKRDEAELPKEKCAEPDDDAENGEGHKEKAPEEKGKDKGKAKDDAGVEEAEEGAVPSTLPVKQREFTCPLSSCQCAVSLDDLKQALAVFGAQGGPSFVSASPGHGHLKQSLPSKLTASLLMFIESNECFIICPNEKCGMAFERLPPSEDEKKASVKDDEGKAVVGPALAHYHEFRFRCRLCDTIFCSACKNVPYHTGYTCQQYQQYGRYKHCIICEMPVKKHEESADEGKGKEKAEESVDNTEPSTELNMSGLGPMFGAEDSDLSEAADPNAARPVPQQQQANEGQPAAVEISLSGLVPMFGVEDADGGDINAAPAAAVLNEAQPEPQQQQANEGQPAAVEVSLSGLVRLASEISLSDLVPHDAAASPEREQDTGGAAQNQQEPVDSDEDRTHLSYCSEDEEEEEDEEENKDEEEKEERSVLLSARSSRSGSGSSEASSDSDSESSGSSDTDTDSDDGSSDEEPAVAQPPPPPRDGLDYEEVYGVVGQAPVPVRAFEKHIPGLPRGIFFWRKRRVRRVQQELVLERDAWIRQEQERFAREEAAYNQAQEALRKRIELGKQERAEAQEYLLENECCGEDDCIQAIKCRCLKRLDCRHYCYGLALEEECLHCLHPDCVQEDKQTKDDYCNICWVEGLGTKPSIALTCGHVFHYECVKKKLMEGWPTAVISFAFMDCPLCNARMDHPALRKTLTPLLELEKYIIKAGVERIKLEGMLKDESLINPHSPYYNNHEKFGLDTFAFYMCFRCNSPYFGGKKECANLGGAPGAGGAEGGRFDKKELICGTCSSTSGQTCSIHGEEYLEWKCRFCCRLATYFCSGRARFCDPCHNVPGERVEFNDWETLPEYLKNAPKCDGPSSCPLGVYHPPNGTEEYCIGCVLCRALATQGVYRFNSTVGTA